MAGTVLLRRGALGDVVLLGAITAALPRPVTVVTAPAWAPVAARLRGVDAVVSWPGDAPARAVAAALPAGRIVDLHATVRSVAVSRAAGGAGARIHKHGVRRRLRLARLPLASRPSVVALYARAAGVPPQPGPWIDVPARPRRALAVIPGAAWATKRVDPTRLADAASRWDGPVIALGGPGDDDACAQVAAACAEARVVVERGFDRTLEALAEVAVAVGGDTGLLHLAAATGARVVGLFGSTHPDDGFFCHPGEVVQRRLWCRPCTLKGRAACPLGHARCLELDPAEIADAARRQAATPRR